MPGLSLEGFSLATILLAVFFGLVGFAAVHLPHPARAQRREDLVGAEAGARRKAHRFNPAVQFRTTVIAGEKLPSAIVAKRKR